MYGCVGGGVGVLSKCLEGVGVCNMRNVLRKCVVLVCRGLCARAIKGVLQKNFCLYVCVCPERVKKECSE